MTTMRSTISSVEVSKFRPRAASVKMEARLWDVNQIGTMNCLKIPNNVVIIASVAKTMLTSGSWTKNPQSLFAL